MDRTFTALILELQRIVETRHPLALRAKEARSLFGRGVELIITDREDAN